MSPLKSSLSDWKMTGTQEKLVLFSETITVLQRVCVCPEQKLRAETEISATLHK